MKIKYLLGLCALAASACAITSCSEDTYDVTGNPDNIVYVKLTNSQDASLPMNTYAYNVFHTPAGPYVANQLASEMPVYVKSTKTATSPITVTVELDPTMALPEGYVAFPADGGLNVSLSTNITTIPAGSNVSDTIMVVIDDAKVDWNKFTEDAYLLPIRITSVSGATASEELKFMYVGVQTSVKESMVNTESDDVPGTRLIGSPHTDNFDVTIETPTGRKWEHVGGMFDDRMQTYGNAIVWNSQTIDGESTVTLNMGKPYSVYGFQLTYYGSYYSISDATIETSMDGVNWTTQGSKTWDAYYNYVWMQFWEPLTFQYARFKTHSYYAWDSGAATVLTDIIVYANI